MELYREKNGKIWIALNNQMYTVFVSLEIHVNIYFLCFLFCCASFKILIFLFPYSTTHSAARACMEKMQEWTDLIVFSSKKSQMSHEVKHNTLYFTFLVDWQSCYTCLGCIFCSETICKIEQKMCNATNGGLKTHI